MKPDYWNKTAQTMPQQELKALQLKLIKQQLNYVYDRSPFYRQLYDKHKLRPEKIQTWGDFEQHVPIVRKDDIRDYQIATGDPYGGLACVPQSQLVAIWTSSGTTGWPTMGGYTREDLDIAIEAICRSYWDAGYRPGMRVMTRHGNWHWLTPITWGVIRRLQMRPVMTGINVSAIKAYKPDAFPMITTETAAALLLDAIHKAGEDPHDILGQVQIISTMGESLTDTARENIQRDWGGVQISDGGGCGESYCWFFEGGDPELPGAHYWADIGYAEVFDPDSMEKIGDVGRGELIATNLRVKGVPYIRFATEDFVDMMGDHSTHFSHPYGKILGRSIWRVNVNGNSFLPYDIERILQRFPETAKAQFFISKEAPVQDKLTVSICYDERLTPNPDTLRDKLTTVFSQDLGVASEITWVPLEVIPRPAPHKLVKFIDRTKKK